MPSSGVSKMMKVAVLAVRELAEQLVVHHDSATQPLGRQRTKPARPTSSLSSFRPSRGQQHAERRDHAHQPALLVGGFQHDDGQAGIGAVSATTLWIRAHCSVWAPGGVSQRICQSPCTERTAPCALARPWAEQTRLRGPARRRVPRNRAASRAPASRMVRICPCGVHRPVSVRRPHPGRSHDTFLWVWSCSWSARCDAA